MAKNRMFGDTPKRRLIVSVDDMTIDAIDKLLKPGRNTSHPAAGNRSEFVRMAIKRELKAWTAARPTKGKIL
ncbi:ribbon-helix-helix domain-containing protein [Marinobacter sp.]|uniref:ribbon-helix-helix domain-containing protein n=1 Tax=Marinobacter sp. TaxID=50741 RepID=UPI0035C6C7D2